MRVLKLFTHVKFVVREGKRWTFCMCICTIWSFPLNSSALTYSIFYMVQVSESAKKDLKEGMKLYNSENNVGLKNAWNIIQAEVTYFLNSNKVTIWSSRLLLSLKRGTHA